MIWAHPNKPNTFYSQQQKKTIGFTYKDDCWLHQMEFKTNTVTYNFTVANTNVSMVGGTDTADICDSEDGKT